MHTLTFHGRYVTAAAWPLWPTCQNSPGFSGVEGPVQFFAENPLPRPKRAAGFRRLLSQDLGR